MRNISLKLTRFYCLLTLILIVICYILIFNSQIYCSSSLFPFSITLNSYLSSLLPRDSSDQCKWTFDHYSPSLWELYWYNNISYLQNHVCSTLMQQDQINKSILLLEYIIDLQKTLFNQSLISNRYDDLLSKMYYRYECLYSSHSNLVVSQDIEPLIGLLRDPLSICLYKEIPVRLKMYAVHALQSKRFFLLGPSAPYHKFQSIKPYIAPWLHKPNSQKILFDIGSSYFNGVKDLKASSLTVGMRWFYEYFRNLSLNFDRIIAFEAEKYEPQIYWDQIPADILSAITFLNIGVNSTGKYNPWNILKSLATVDDYVIVKLDIDTPKLEKELIYQIINDTTISSLIDEMFFEMHVRIIEMVHYWGIHAPGDLRETYLLFTQLRKLGIRMHSWP